MFYCWKGGQIALKSFIATSVGDSSAWIISAPIGDASAWIISASIGDSSTWIISASIGDSSTWIISSASAAAPKESLRICCWAACCHGNTGNKRHSLFIYNDMNIFSLIKKNASKSAPRRLNLLKWL